ncbi:MAG TPA: M48 family metallopeptidase [Candidatus Koribacter sp.]
MKRLQPVAVMLGLAVLISLSSYSFSENVKDAKTSLLTINADLMAEDVAALPAKLPMVMMPVVKPPVAVPLGNKRLTKEMEKLAVKYDVRKIGERKVGKGLNFYSPDKEVEMGRELSEEMDLSLKLVHDPVVTEYVNRLGQNLVRNSDAKVPFTIKVVDDPEVNAMALPGGFFYVNTGLIMAADSEAELAGVMSHEIAHVAARHATHNMSRRDLFNLCTIPAVFVAGPAGMAIREIADMALPAEMMKFSRDAEREADLLGMQYAYAAGYDPAAIVSFFEKIEAQEKHKKGFLARTFDTHPMTEERVKRAQEEMEVMLPAKEDYVVTTSEFSDVKERVQALVNHHVLADPVSNKPVLRKSAAEDDGPPVLKRGSD